MDGTGDPPGAYHGDANGAADPVVAFNDHDDQAAAGAAGDWDERLSWEDSERFDGDDSLCSSPYSDSESMCQNWRGWSAATAGTPPTTTNVGANNHTGGGSSTLAPSGSSMMATTSTVPPSYTGGLTTMSPAVVGVGGGSSSTLVSPQGVGGAASPGRSSIIFILPLVELAAKRVASDVPFEVVERYHLPVPESLQLRIAYWSFPGNEEEVRLYSCLANGNVDEFSKGQALFDTNSVENLLQIGFHLSGVVVNLAQPAVQMTSRNNSHNLLLSQPLTSSSSSTNAQASCLTSAAAPKRCNVAVTLDRCKITSCNCTCNPNVSWCAHVVALCLHRIHRPSTVCFRAPLSESLSRLEKEQLQKFSQYLISEWPHYFLPKAQKLLDALLSQKGPMNVLRGAPDPTAGASLNDVASWCLEEQTLHENIKKIMHKFCQPTPTVCDVNYLSSNAPPAASEWTALLRPLRGREPEGLFNLLSIVQEMYCRHDSNAVTLLNIITQECLACDQVVLWWFHTKLLQCSNAPQLNLVHAPKPPASSTSSSNVGGPHAPSSQYSCATLFDAIVALWRLAALNPGLTDQDRRQVFSQLKQYHVRAVEKVFKILNDMQQNTRRLGQSHGSNAASAAATNQNATLGSAHSLPVGTYGGQTSRGPSFSSLLSDPNAHVRFDLESFPGFKSALETCAVDDFWAPIAAPSFDVGDDSSLNDALNECYSSLRETARRTSFTTTTARTSSQSPCGAGAASPTAMAPSMPPGGGAESSGSTASSTTLTSLMPPVDGPGSSSTSPALAKTAAPTPRDDIDRLYMAEPLSDDDEPGSSTNRAPIPKTAAELAEEALSFLQPVRDRVDLLFARCEGLAAHGCADDACRLAAHLARHLCAGAPNLLSTNDVTATTTTTDSSLTVADPAPEPSGFCGSGSAVKFSVGSGSASGPNPCRLGSPDRPGDLSNKNKNVKRANGGATTRRKKRPSTTVADQARSAAIPDSSFVAPTIVAPSFDVIADDSSSPQRRQPTENARLSALASATLAKAHFLFNVLYQDKSKHKLAFRLGLWALQLLRRPAASKFVEVKLYHQESEIVNNLKRLELGHEEMNMLRECASKFRNGFYSSEPLSVLPLSLATYLFECLCGAGSGTGNNLSLANNAGSTRPSNHSHGTPKDDQLGFEAAVAALSLKSNMAEAEHPLLCEGIRRQKGELALALLLRYKDDSSKVALIMDQLLDFEMHRMYKHHTSNAIPFVNGNVGHANKPGGASVTVTTTYICSAPFVAVAPVAGPPSTSTSSPPMVGVNAGGGGSLASSRRSSFGGNGNAGGATPSIDGAASVDAATETSDVSDVLEELMLSEEIRDEDGNVDWSPVDNVARRNNAGGSRAARMPSGDSSSVDSSSSGVSRDVASRLTSSATSANSATPARSSVFRPDRGAYPAPSSASPALNSGPAGPSSTIPKSIDPLNKNCYMKISRQRKYVTPSVPNQPSEAHAHFMGELAKRLLTEAGGNHSTAIFTTPQGGPQANQAHGGGPHRALHLCAFQIGLYALGLHNKVTPNWLSRTYSSHVSWISGQAMEIGRMAIHVLIASWENHLTPTEVANLADKGSQSRDPAMVSASADLALSALSQAHALSQPDIQRALAQCREQNSQMLIKACLAVEQAAKDGGVYPDVLFKVGQQWHHMYTDSVGGDQQAAEATSASPSAHHSSPHQHQHHQQHHHPHTPRGNDRTFVGDCSSTVAPSFVDVVVVPTIPMLPPPPPQQPSTPTSHFTTQPPPPFHAAQLVASPPPGTTAQHHFGHGPHALPFQHHKGHFGAPFDAAQQQTRTALMGPAPMPNPAVFGRPQSTTPGLLSTNQNNNGAQAMYAQFPIMGQPPPPLIGGAPQLVQQRTVPLGRAPPAHFLNHAHHHHQPQQQFANNNHGNGHSHNMLPMVMTSSGLLPMQHQQHHHQLVQFGTAYGTIPARIMHGQIDISMSHPPPPTPAPSRDPVAGNNCYLYAAYRVGMLALETLGRRIHDERSYVKYAQNPPYGDDVKWLLGVSRKLGPAYVQQFCSAAVQAVVSPFVLWDLATETAVYFAPRNPTMAHHHTAPLQLPAAESSRLWLTKALAHPCVQPLMQRCMQTFSIAANQKLSHPRFMQSDAEEVCNLVRTAHTAFHHSNENFNHANKSFDDFMQLLRRQKACKKDLWNRLMNLVNVC